MGVHSVASRVVEFSNTEDLDLLRRDRLLDNAFILGGGSNVLFTGATYGGTIVRPAMNGVTLDRHGDSAVLTAESGCRLDDVVDAACAQGLWGLENLSLIPGNIGGAIVQNCGAYGAEIADCLTSVDLYDMASGSQVTLDRKDLNMSYRHSCLKEAGTAGRMIVVRARFTLSATPRPNLSYKALADAVAGRQDLSAADLRTAVIAIRRAKLPDVATTGSVGSYFKNPVLSGNDARAFADAHPDAPVHINETDKSAKLSAAWLIDRAGCKPMACGGASLWPTQPLVIVNRGNATGADILALEKAVRERVESVFGITLECEVVKLS